MLSYGEQYIVAHGIDKAKERIDHLTKRSIEELHAYNYSGYENLCDELNNIQNAVTKMENSILRKGQ